MAQAGVSYHVGREVERHVYRETLNGVQAQNAIVSSVRMRHRSLCCARRLGSSAFAAGHSRRADPAKRGTVTVAFKPTASACV